MASMFGGGGGGGGETVDLKGVGYSGLSQTGMDAGKETDYMTALQSFQKAGQAGVGSGGGSGLSGRTQRLKSEQDALMRRLMES